MQNTQITIRPGNTSIKAGRTLEKIVSTIGDLPASPAIIATLMNLTSDINTDVDKISQALLADQSLTARILRLSNSSFYGRSKEVRTIREAVVILGFKTLRSLVIAASTHSLYQDKSENGFENVLWQHSLATAVACRLVAQAAGHPFVEEAFIAGLLHDIGKLVLIQKMHDTYAQIIHRAEAEKSRFLDLEEADLGFTHCDVGMLLLQNWAFPPVLTDAVFEHHQPIAEGEKAAPLSCIVNLGNCLAKSVEVGFNDFRTDNLSSQPSAIFLRLDNIILDGLQAQLAAQYTREKDLFS